MAIMIKQISSLEKVRKNEKLTFKEISKKTVMRGERISYQLVINAPNERAWGKLWCEAPFDVKLYSVKEVIVDHPATEDISAESENYIIKEAGYLPDVLVPLEEQNGLVSLKGDDPVIWVKADVPTNMKVGKYSIKIYFAAFPYGNINAEPIEKLCVELEIEVIESVLPEQKLIYTRWFYADCISDIHNVEIFSEAHWELIDKYIAAAADVGINMILVPVHTPPLDTEVGTTRPCVQLVDIEKKGDTYIFGFERFSRFIALCRKNGIKYYEIAHMFSQWGSEFAPNIMVSENGKKNYMFGWNVRAESEEYRAFLKQYIKAISDELVKEGISENSYFHISDEPNLNNIERYETAYNIIKPLIKNSKTMDALSHVEFYEKGFVEYPVTSVRAVHTFIDHKIENVWTYYCCGPQTVFTNSFLAMPSARVRILGFLLYKYNIKGFLHWGFNYYNAERSIYRINPYVTTSADGAYPSGDGFIVYPGPNSVYPSIRGEVTYQAIEDMRVCEALEERIGREAVVAIIDKAAGRNLRFDDYPCDNAFLEGLREQMIKMLKNN